METATAISLLTVNVIVLSVVILALLIIVIVLLIKLNKLVSNMQHVSENVAKATEWLSPVKVFSELGNIFRSFTKR